MANGLHGDQSDGNTTGPILDVVDSAASLMMQSNGNGFHAANNLTEEFFYVPTPKPRFALSSPPSAQSSARDLGRVDLAKSMSDLNLNGTFR